MSTNQRLNASITIGAALDRSVGKSIGFLQAGLANVGAEIKNVTNRQRELSAQRRVLERQGQSVEALDREYEDLERTLRDLKRAQDRWNNAAAAGRRVGSSFSEMTSNIGKNARQITVGLALAGGAAFGVATSTAELGDAVAKTADKLGIGIDALQEYQYAAERSGVSSDTFDMALQRSVRRIAEAANGTGEAVGALDDLGLSAQALNDMGPEQALMRIADAMAEVESPSERVRLAMKLFDSEGVSMVNMLGDGSAALTQLREDARRTGYVLSEKTARDAEVFQDTLLDTTLVMKGLKNTVGAELMPVVTKAMRRVGDALLDNREEVQLWANKFADGVERVLPIVGEVVTGMLEVSGVVGSVVSQTAEMVGGWENFGVIVGTVLASRTVVLVGKFGASVFKLGRAFVVLGGALPFVAGGIRAVGLALMANPIGLAVAAVAAAGLLIYKNWDTVGPWFKEQWELVETYFGGLADFVTGVFTLDMERAGDGLVSAWQGYGGLMEGVLDLMGFNVDDLSLVTKSAMDAMGLTEPLTNAWEKASSTLDTVITGIGDIFTTVWDATISPVMNKLSDLGGVEGAWKSLKTSIGEVLDWLGDKFTWVGEIIAPVVDSLRWVKEKGVGVLGALGIIGPDLSDGGSGNGSIQERAVGGAYKPGWLLTGENGPELRFENRAGYIADNRALRQMAGYASTIGSAKPRQVSLVNSANMIASPSHGQTGSAASTAPQGGDTIHIYAQGTSAEEIFTILERRQRTRAQGGLYDRAPATGPYGR